jgi:hypothetical protein
MSCAEGSNLELLNCIYLSINQSINQSINTKEAEFLRQLHWKEPQKQ